jgi:hypothetical protein
VDAFDLAMVFYLVEFFKSTGMEGLADCDLAVQQGKGKAY